MAERIQRSILISDPLPSGLGVCIHYQPPKPCRGILSTPRCLTGRIGFIADATGHVVRLWARS